MREEISTSRLRLISAAITIIALIAISAHIAKPTMMIDSITVSLIVIAIVPWLVPLIKSIQFGDFKLEFWERLKRVENDTASMHTEMEMMAQKLEEMKKDATPDSEPNSTTREMEKLLTPEVRSTIREAMQDEVLWESAKGNAAEFLQSRGIKIPEPLTLAFFDVEQAGDWLQFLGPGHSPILEEYCPPTKVWWEQCRKIARVCEKETVIINGEVKEIEKNCYFVCEEFITDPEITLPTRPPWPPIPLP